MNCCADLWGKSIPRGALALIALVGLALPVNSRATTIVNTGGSILGSNTGLSLTSTVMSVGSITGVGILGSLNIQTGALLSGSLGAGGMFNGGTIKITANANGVLQGLPACSGCVFNGTFTGPVTWAVQTNPDGTLQYTLSGAVAGTSSFLGGSPLGGTTQITLVLKAPLTPGKRVGLAGGVTSLATTPEPGTFGLLGSGLIGLAGIVRRRVFSSRPRSIAA